MQPIDDLDLFRDKTRFAEFFHGVKIVSVIDRSGVLPVVSSYHEKDPTVSGPSMMVAPKRLSKNMLYITKIYWERVESVTIPCNGTPREIGKSYAYGYVSTLSASSTSELQSALGVFGLKSVTGKISDTVGYSVTSSVLQTKDKKIIAQPPKTGTTQYEIWVPVVETHIFKERLYNTTKPHPPHVIKVRINHEHQVTHTRPEPKCGPAEGAGQRKIEHTDDQEISDTLLAGIANVPSQDLERLAALDLTTAADLVALDPDQVGALGLTEKGEGWLLEGAFEQLHDLAERRMKRI